MKILMVIVVIGVLAFLGWNYFSAQPASLPDASEEPSAGEGPKEHIIEMTSSGFSPSTSKLKVGDTVKFINSDTVSHWPASFVHPVHQCFPGLDALRPLAPGDSYSFTFEIAKTCGVHDHLKPASIGSITVE